MLVDWVLEMGVPKERVTLAPAFLPPSPQEVDESNLSESLRDFLATHDPVIANHAAFGVFMNGVHVYSLDMVCELVLAVRQKYPNAGICTFVGFDSDSAHRAEVLHRRKVLGLERDWMIVEQSHAAVAAFARSDLFVRPTTTDGDSISIRECLSLGVPVVASDVVWRPPGCTVFRNRDMADFARAVLDVLGDLPKYQKQVGAVPTVCHAEAVRDVYRQVLGL
jgi:glycosyltransferase involved in cell wall biosynthesis